MVTFKRVGNQFQISFKWDGYPRLRALKVRANDLEEVHTAIDHYYAKKHNEVKCPLCRQQK